MKVLTIEEGQTACVVRAVIALTRAERRTFECGVPTEQLVVYGVVLIPERGRRARRFEWRTHLGVLPATLAAALSRVADDFLEQSLEHDPTDVTGHLARVFTTGMVPVPDSGSGHDIREWSPVDIRDVAAVGSGLLRDCLLDRARARKQISGGSCKAPAPKLRLVKG